jgi:hypothetical protein
MDTRSFDVSPLFASGAVYTSSILDIVLSQVGAASAGFVWVYVYVWVWCCGLWRCQGTESSCAHLVLHLLWWPHPPLQAMYNPSVILLLEQLIAGMDAVGAGRTRAGDRGGVLCPGRGGGALGENALSSMSAVRLCTVGVWLGLRGSMLEGGCPLLFPCLTPGSCTVPPAPYCVTPGNGMSQLLLGMGVVGTGLSALTLGGSTSREGPDGGTARQPTGDACTCLCGWGIFPCTCQTACLIHVSWHGGSFYACLRIPSLSVQARDPPPPCFLFSEDWRPPVPFTRRAIPRAGAGGAVGPKVPVDAGRGVRVLTCKSSRG